MPQRTDKGCSMRKHLQDAMTKPLDDAGRKLAADTFRYIALGLEQVK